MKRLTGLLVALLFVISTGCASDFKTADGRTYSSVGVITMNEKNPCLKYRAVVGNVLLAAFFLPSVVLPVYFVGFSMWEPYSVKQSCMKK